jgi:hypothetical protein
MSYTARFTEVNELLARLPPLTYNGGVSTPWIAMNDFHRAIVIFSVGTLTGTLDGAVFQATNLAGAGAKAVAGKAITQLAATDDEVICGIELKTEELDVDGGFDCIRIQTVSSAVNVFGVIVFGTTPRYAEVGVTEWDEVVD